MGVEKEYETDVGEEGVLSYEFCYTKRGASAESYTKKATGKDVGYEFCYTKSGASAESYTKKATGKEDGYEFLIKEEELMYYEFYQQVVELEVNCLDMQCRCSKLSC